MVLMVLVLWLAVRARTWIIRAVGFVAGGILGLTALVQFVVWLATNGVTTSTAGLLLLLVVAVTAGLGGWLGVRVSDDRVPTKRAPRFAPVVVLGLTLFPALAIGRSFVPEGRTVGAIVQAGNTVKQALSTSMSLPELRWSWGTGLCVVLAVWAVWALLPPYRGRRIAAAVTALVVGVAGAPICGHQARTYAEFLIMTEGGDLAETLPDYCTAWKLPGNSGAVEVAISGPHCSLMSLLDRRQVTRSQSLRVNLGPFDNLRYPEGGSIPATVQTGLYRGILVAVATDDRRSGSPNLVVGLSTTNLTETWRYTCGSGALSVRFAQIPGADRPDQGAKTLKGEKPAVVVRCGSETLRLAPASGKSAG